MNRPSTTALDPGALPVATAPRDAAVAVKPVALGILGALSASHLINDMMQSLILALYPVLKGTFSLSFTQIGLITLTYQLTASLFQPLIGLYTDLSLIHISEPTRPY